MKYLPFEPITMNSVIDLYEGVAQVIEICIDQDDIVTAQECKIKIAEFLFKLLQDGVSRQEMRIFGKFVRLEIIINKFILLRLRAAYVELESPDEDA